MSETRKIEDIVKYPPNETQIMAVMGAIGTKWGMRVAVDDGFASEIIEVAERLVQSKSNILKVKNAA